MVEASLVCEGKRKRNGGKGSRNVTVGFRMQAGWKEITGGQGGQVEAAVRG